VPIPDEKEKPFYGLVCLIRKRDAGALLEHLTVNHPFVDGNKRVASAAMEIFLLINGWRINATQQQIYRFMMRLFDGGRFELSELDKWFRPRIVKDING
jgi:death-on-curing protein